MIPKPSFSVTAAIAETGITGVADVCYRLWEGSWEEDAVVDDREAQVYADPEKVHEIDVDDIRRIAAEEGRDPRSLKIFTEICTVLAPTDEEARAKYEDYLSWTDYEGALAFYAGITGIDLSQLDPHQPLEYVDTDSARFALEIFSKADPDKAWTPHEVARFVGIGAMSPVLVGSPATVADELERWLEEADIDGFNLAYAVTPGTFVDFIDLVVPELQRRGRYWRDYDDGTTLRERLYGPGHPRVRDDHPAAQYRRALEGAVPA